MPQEPDIDISKIESKEELPMPVPRRTDVRPAENIKPNSDEVFGNTGPDSCLLYTSPSPRDRG